MSRLAFPKKWIKELYKSFRRATFKKFLKVGRQKQNSPLSDIGPDIWKWIQRGQLSAKHCSSCVEQSRHLNCEDKYMVCVPLTIHFLKKMKFSNMLKVLCMKGLAGSLRWCIHMWPWLGCHIYWLVACIVEKKKSGNLGTRFQDTKSLFSNSYVPYIFPRRM